MAVANLWQAILRGLLQAHQSSVLPTLTAAEIAQAGKKYAYGIIPTDAAAGTQSEVTICTAQPAGGITITACTLLPSAALTANASTFATYQLGTRPNAGGGSQTAAATALTTATVSWVASSAIPLVITGSSGFAVATGLNVTLNITKASTGVITPLTLIQLEYFET